MSEVQILLQEYKQQLADINEERNIYLAKCAILQEEKAKLHKKVDDLEAKITELTPKEDEEEQEEI